MVALERVVQRTYDVEINRLLVPFGTYILLAAPNCPSCLVADICFNVGVTSVRS